MRTFIQTIALCVVFLLSGVAYSQADVVKNYKQVVVQFQNDNIILIRPVSNNPFVNSPGASGGFMVQLFGVTNSPVQSGMAAISYL